MGNILGILGTGVSGLFAAQAQIDVAGNNITNVNTEGYSRQRVSLVTSSSQVTQYGVFGRGVTIENIVQIYDSVLANTIRNETSDLAYYTTTQDALTNIEIYFNELEDGSGLGEAMSEYFAAWSDLANTATDQSDEALIKKQTVVEKADLLAEKIRASYTAMEQVKQQSNNNVKDYVSEINTISQNISYLNSQIAMVEATGQMANDLRDKREILLNDLSELTNVSVVERTSGQIAVYVGGNALVDEGAYYQLRTAQTSGSDTDFSIFWGTPSSVDKLGVDVTESFSSGKIGGELTIRDSVVQSYMDSLNDLAATLIVKTNELHSVGQGSDKLTQITSSSGVKNASYPLSDPAGALPSAVTAGVMRITIYDSDGKVVDNLDIEIDPKVDTMNSIISKISYADGNPNGGIIQASLSQNNTIKIYSESGYSFSFAEDTSGFLTASGTYGFFSGENASNIGVSSLIKENISYLATSKSGAVGDNQNAKAIADLKGSKVFSQNVTLDEYYALFVGKIATDKSTADTYATTKLHLVTEYSKKLESIKGVSLDEEMAEIIRFQRAYEASARFINVVDEMIDKIVNGLGTGGR
ncbi:flagellar hook-associated protein FlgK [Seleniivibrio woodruffii]|uniref:flagellar hook-associated protein FlgK n=1 Tax=Seleniivibrio woodruffii TaxID=1078050 RepID=UPI0024096C80|nr:flagellar hook-associated protein FlgK [Seleniivibrio woodruffii]